MPSRLLATLNPQVIARDGRVCQYCGTTEAFSYAVDHIVSRSQGGPNHVGNLVVACQQCNILKRGEVWVPRNFEQITAEYPEWYEQVLAMAVPPHGPKDTDKPYTFRRLDIATMNRLEAYCKPRTGKGQGKGAIVSEALARWLDEHDA